jgi:hypothetical protein
VFDGGNDHVSGTECFFGGGRTQTLNMAVVSP